MIPESWRKSSYSSSGNCIEVGDGHQAVLVRDTKNQGTGPELKFSPDEWRRFIGGLKAE